MNSSRPLCMCEFRCTPRQAPCSNNILRFSSAARYVSSSSISGFSYAGGWRRKEGGLDRQFLLMFVESTQKKQKVNTLIRNDHVCFEPTSFKNINAPDPIFDGICRVPWLTVAFRDLLPGQNWSDGRALRMKLWKYTNIKGNAYTCDGGNRQKAFACPVHKESVLTRKNVLPWEQILSCKSRHLSDGIWYF